MRVALVGLAQFEAALRKVQAQAEVAAKTSVVKAAAMVEKEAKGNFSGSHKKGQPHVGGNKPNVVSGDLRRSITTDPLSRYGMADWGTKVAPRMIYGRRIELGWPSVGLHAYPYFMEPAERARAEFPKIAAEQWRLFLQAT